MLWHIPLFLLFCTCGIGVCSVGSGGKDSTAAPPSLGNEQPPRTGTGFRLAVLPFSNATGKKFANSEKIVLPNNETKTVEVEQLSRRITTEVLEALLARKLPRIVIIDRLLIDNAIIHNQVQLLAGNAAGSLEVFQEALKASAFVLGSIDEIEVQKNAPAVKGASSVIQVTVKITVKVNPASTSILSYTKAYTGIAKDLEVAGPQADEKRLILKALGDAAENIKKDSDLLDAIQELAKK